MIHDLSKYQLYFDDPRIRMTFLGRMIVRAFGYISYLFLVAAAATFLFADLKQLKAIGILLLLFLVDHFLHAKEADKHLSELPPGGTVNVARYAAPAAFSVLEHSYQKSALARRHFFLESALEFSNLPSVHEGLRRLDIHPDEFKEKIEDLMSGAPAALEKKERQRQAETLALHAFALAVKNEHLFISPADMFSALPLVGDELMQRLFKTFSIEPDDLELSLTLSSAQERFSFLQRAPKNVGSFMFESQKRLRHRIVNRAWTSLQTRTLDKYSTDYTDLARRGQIGFLIGHKAEYERLADTLARPVNPNAMLVGESGSGKEAIVGHLAFNLIKDKVPPALFDKRLVALHLGDLVAGASPEELQNRLKQMVEEIYMAENVILYIPDIHNLVKTSGSAFLSAADALMPIISSNAFPIIGGSYPKEFKESLEPRSDFVSAFEVIRVQEINAIEAEQFLVYQGLILENQSKIMISFAAIKEAVALAKKYFHQKPLPSSAVDLLKDAVIEASRHGEKALGADGIIRAAERKVNVPIHKAGETEAEALLNLEAIIHKRFIDQEQAVAAVADALRQYRSGLTRPGGPIATFLFVGPTGVGKTELSKLIAQIQFGSENLMVRFDMSEYQDKQSFFRFIGSPDGKVSGALTDAVLQKPYSLILLDEFEKAYPDILTLFLQVFDDGRLTDNLGRTVDFQNTIIIATSNAHSEFIKSELDRGNTVPGIAEALKKKLVDYFKPELLNRFSKIIVFSTLAPDALEAVAELNLKDLAKILENQGIRVSFQKSVVKKIAALGYDPSFGARPLRRVIDEKLRAPLAEKILRKEIVKGADVNVVLVDDEIKFVVVSSG